MRLEVCHAVTDAVLEDLPDIATSRLQAEAIGGEHQLRVLCSDAKRNRFIECDAAKNVYGG